MNGEEAGSVPAWEHKMKNKRKSSSRCRHSEVVVTVTAGIERVVCMSCGQVRIGYDHETCMRWPSDLRPPDRAAQPELIGLLGS